MLIDTHCHLDAAEFDADRDAVVRAANDGGVAQVIVPAIASFNFAAVRDCCVRYPGCRPAYGLHPLFVDRAAPDELALLRQWLERERSGPHPPVAVGEIGLDRYVAGYDEAAQQHYLGEQLKIAREFDLPVLLHVRRAVDAVLREVRRSGVRGGIAHAFNGSRQQADGFIALGFKLGFGGAMTHPGSTRIRRLAAELPLSAIVLETDAPDIPPRWLDGGRNTPGELPRIAGVLAELRSIPLDTVMQATTENAVTVFAQCA